MTDVACLKVEFRVPISPTPGFFAQVRFFNFGLRRLGRPYRQARLVVCVGDNCDIEWVRAQNAWSKDFPVEWLAVPWEVFGEFGIHGTADYRWTLPPGDRDIVILSDADTVLMRDIDPLLEHMPKSGAAIRGHMAHGPPPHTRGLPNPARARYWPTLFERAGAPWPDRLHSYSIGGERQPAAPAYLNLGMIAVTPQALTGIGDEIFDFQRRLARFSVNPMRCQIAVSLLAYRLRMDIDIVPAAFNAANDLRHLDGNSLTAADIRVLHYLRTEEADRSVIFQDAHIDSFLSRRLSNPANQALQALAREYRASRLDLAPVNE